MQRQLRRLQACPQLVIVAHPDDETLWAGATIAALPGTGVLCLTNRGERTRRRAFMAAMKAVGARAVITDVPDRRDAPITAADDALMRQLIRQSASRDQARVITHAPEGEYGHVLHRRVSTLVAEEAQALGVPVWYFDFTADATRALGVPPAKQAALDAYFPPDTGIAESDDVHIRLSRHECPTPASEYRGRSPLIPELYGLPE